jgi:two-component system, OmpR family, response regulator RpaA
MNKRKILIIDDEISLTTILKKCLERTDKYEVRIENQSTNAVTAIRDFKPDLILLDIMMPKINGNKIAEYVQNNKELKHIKIVFLTAILNIDEIEKKADKAEACLVIGKPVKFDELVECIEEQLQDMNLL